MGRPISELLRIYNQYINLPLSNYEQLSENISLSRLNQLTLEEYCQVREAYCSFNHSCCSECPLMLKAAAIVLKAGICTLQSETFPRVTYHAGNAKRRLLQMPLVANKVKNLTTQRSEIHVTELIKGVDYLKFSHFLNASATSRENSKPTFSKADLKQLLILAQSDRERELIKYTTLKASGLSKSTARKRFGFQNLSERCMKVEESIHEAECIDTTSSRFLSLGLTGSS